MEMMTLFGVGTSDEKLVCHLLQREQDQLLVSREPYLGRTVSS